MAGTRNPFDQEFSDLLNECGLVGVITPQFRVDSFLSINKIEKKQHLLIRNKSGLSWLMLCHEALTITPKKEDKEFYATIFLLFMGRALFSLDCFDELVALKDKQNRTIFDRVASSEGPYLWDKFIDLFMFLRVDEAFTFFWLRESPFEKSVNLFKKYQSQLLGCDILLLDNYPKPSEQHGFHCGYYAIDYAIKCWNVSDSAHRAYPARLFGSAKKTGVSLKALGKEAGLKGVGGIFDVRFFASILQTTSYQSQVVEFETEDELRSLLMLSLAHQVPVILPVDWNDEKISKSEGKFAHYITIVGYVSGRNYQQGFFASSDRFYNASIKTLFASNDNLKLLPSTLFYKKEHDRVGWQKHKDPSTKQLPGCKYRFEEEKELSGLRRKMVLVYPNTLEAKFKEIFSEKAITGLRSSVAKPKK